MNLLHLGILIIAVNSVVEIIHHGELFNPLKNHFNKYGPLLINKLLNCPFCLSVWVGIFFAFIYLIINPIWLLISLPFCLCRCAQLLNDINKLLINKFKERE